MKLANSILRRSLFSVVLLVLTGCPGMPGMGGKGPGGGPDGGGGCPKCNPKGGPGGVPSASRKGPGEGGDGVHSEAKGTGNGADPVDQGPATGGTALGGGVGGPGGLTGSSGLSGGAATNGVPSTTSTATPTPTDTPTASAPTGGSAPTGTDTSPGIPTEVTSVQLLKKVEPLASCEQKDSPLAKWVEQANEESSLIDKEGGPPNPINQAIKEEFGTINKAFAADVATVASQTSYNLVLGRARSQVLRCLVAKGKDKVLEILLKSGWDPNFENEKGETALKLAIQSGSASTVKVLLAAGAKADDLKKRLPLLPDNSAGTNDLLLAISKLKVPVAGVTDDKASLAARLLVVRMLAEYQYKDDKDMKLSVDTGSISVLALGSIAMAFAGTPTLPTEASDAIFAILYSMEKRPNLGTVDPRYKPYLDAVTDSKKGRLAIFELPPAGSIPSPDKYKAPAKP